jgi:hypothetical protein
VQIKSLPKRVSKKAIKKSIAKPHGAPRTVVDATRIGAIEGMNPYALATKVSLYS